MRFALRHELTHLKRGDHIVCLMMLILRAVYWFHPVVWAAAKLMRLDMETACDSTVTRQMCAGSKMRYAQAILSMHLKPQLRYALGMALGSTKKTVERRIKGIFMRSKTGNKARFVALILTAVMVAACFTTACQPTPERQTVVQRDELDEKLTGATVSAYEAPDHWTETAERDPLTINIDADVIMPDVRAFPVIKVEPVPFSQERVDELVHYFAGDRRLVLPHVKTKSDYDEEIILAKRGQEVDGGYEVTDSSLEWVKELEKMRDAAPEDSPIVHTDATLTYDVNQGGAPDTSTSKNYLNVEIEGENGASEGHILAYNYVEGESEGILFGYYAATDYTRESDIKTMVEENRQFQEDYANEPIMEDPSLIQSFQAAEETYERLKLVKIEITLEDAQAQAQQVLHDFGIEGMYLLSAQRALLEPYSELTPGVTDEGGYAFEYVRQSGGIPGYGRRSYGYFNGEEPPEYSPPFEQENVRILVTQEGIMAFSWEGSARVVETVTENTELLKFEEVIERFKDRVFYESAFGIKNDYSMQGAMIDVDAVELRVGYINVKDNVRQAMLVPVWVFKTTTSYIRSDGKTRGRNHDSYIFNAIDGGYIKEPLD